MNSSFFQSSSSSHTWIYDVFPSFRGEDVRRNFLSHVQKEFKRNAITFFNDNGIKRGESIGPELRRAISGSKIAIILISKNYASSKWCLDELVEIMKCRKDLGQIVMVVFYKVDPSHVKKLAGDFGKVFRKTCAGQTMENKRRWSQALKEVATIVGYPSGLWDNESDMIEKIATDVLKTLINSAPSSDFDNLVGMGAHIEKMKPLLRIDSDDEVRMIGIWGPSGIGKSTFARVLFGEYSHHFQLSVFMDNIKRRYPIPYYDEYKTKLQLQQDFLSQITHQEDMKIHHLGVAQDRLKAKKVLAVIDDVDHLAQLDAMAKENRWFGPGSRIIITTQDKRLLNAHGINQIYKMGFPANDEALQIFCTYAFGQKYPYDGFEMLAREVVNVASKLPLGLRVMGSHFKGMSEQVWENELPRLRTSINVEIESILKFSYDALHEEDRALFLYIACFFNGKEIEKVEAHLANDFSNVRQGLHILQDKSLISIERWRKTINMHSLLALLGREIVRKQPIDDPSQRKFLVDARDIRKVLRNDIDDISRVLGIDLKCFEIEKELNTPKRAFERTSSLRFLKAGADDQVHVLQQIKNKLPQRVSLLHWKDFPMKCLPSHFNPEFLVELNMPNSNLEKLWVGKKTISNLKWIELRESEQLKELPDLSTAINLQELNVNSCSSLVELPSSIGNAINLQELHMYRCPASLPTSIENLINLKILRID